MANDTDYVVVHDPRPPTVGLGEGTIVVGAHQEKGLAQLQAAGVVLLPVDRDLPARGAVSGWHKRSWGAGVPLAGMKGTRCCPLVLQVEPDREFVHLAVHLAPFRGQRTAADAARDLDRRGGQAGVELHPRGQVRLVADPSGGAHVAGGLSAVGLPNDVAFSDDLGAPDRDGGWTLRRVYRLSTTMGGLLPLQLYAVARDVAVQWAAVSQASVGLP